MRLYKCTGISMQKLIINNDIIIVDESSPIKLFDIFMFKKQDTYFCHRCIFSTKKYKIEFGENAKLPSIVRKSDVIGRCVGLLRGNEKYGFSHFSLKYYLLLWKIIITKYIWFNVIGLNNRNTKKYLKQLNKINCLLHDKQKTYLVPIPIIHPHMKG